MNPILGWVLAAVAVLLGWRTYGAAGIAMAVSVIVFWLLLQYSQAIRAMRRAGEAPLGAIDSAVMLNAKLRRSLTMLQLIGLTHSLGRKVQGVEGDPEEFEWTDPGGSTVRVRLERGRLATWELQRPAP
ncbi:MAG: hypothetical protein ABIO45_19185 [Burkholderiaceae bacterium]